MSTDRNKRRRVGGIAASKEAEVALVPLEPTKKEASHEVAAAKTDAGHVGVDRELSAAEKREWRPEAPPSSQLGYFLDRN